MAQARHFCLVITECQLKLLAAVFDVPHLEHTLGVHRDELRPEGHHDVDTGLVTRIDPLQLCAPPPGVNISARSHEHEEAVRGDGRDVGRVNLGHGEEAKLGGPIRVESLTGNCNDKVILSPYNVTGDERNVNRDITQKPMRIALEFSVMI